MSGNYDERDVTFDIIEEIGVISTQETGWAKEINLVRWNGGIAKYDIRDWDPSHERMSRGITLHEDEMRRVLELMKHRRSKFRNRQATAEQSAEQSAEQVAEQASEQPDSVQDNVQDTADVSAESQIAEADEMSYSEN